MSKGSEDTDGGCVLPFSRKSTWDELFLDSFLRFPTAERTEITLFMLFLALLKHLCTLSEIFFSRELFFMNQFSTATPRQCTVGYHYLCFTDEETGGSARRHLPGVM